MPSKLSSKLNQSNKLSNQNLDFVLGTAGVDYPHADDDPDIYHVEPQIQSTTEQMFSELDKPVVVGVVAGDNS